MNLLPISAIIPTIGRRARLLRTLASLLEQDRVPAQILVVDASDRPLRAEDLPSLPSGVAVHCQTAERQGAAAQRNQAVRAATQPYLLFLDDDIDLQPGCLRVLWERLTSDPTLGGCSARLLNASYHPPGKLFRRVLHWVGCPAAGSLAGRCCGPALNFLPKAPARPSEDDHVEWLNLGCTLYRRTALPDPPFLPFFAGYSLLEDVALSTHVAKRWRLACPTGADVHHDSQPADYKTPAFRRERMEVLHRVFVAREILGQRGLGAAMRHVLYQVFMTLVSLRTTGGWRRLPAAAAGKLAGAWAAMRSKGRWKGYVSA